MWGRVRTVGLLALISLVLLEVVLQMLTVGVWLFFPRHDAERFDSGERVVMCIGDSFTFGLGATSLSRSYPGQLQGILQQRLGPEWRVVNRGWPGRCTRDLLERIEEQLATIRPELVYVVAGLNDRYTSAEELVLDAAGAGGAVDGDSLRWEWRTARMFRIFLGWVAGAGGDDLRGLIAGTWVGKQGEVFRFRQDGSGAVQGERVTWSVDGPKLVVARDGAETSGVTVEVDGDVLTLSPGEPSELTLFRVQDVEPTELQRKLEESMGTSPVGSADGEVVETELDRVVASHLNQLIRRCRDAGVSVVLATYPHQSPHAATIRRVASQDGVSLLDIHAAFDAALAAQPDLDLFVPDAHCNDDGYRLMAEVVAGDVVARARPR